MTLSRDSEVNFAIRQHEACRLQSITGEITKDKVLKFWGLQACVSVQLNKSICQLGGTQHPAAFSTYWLGLHPAASDFARDPAGFLARAPLVPIKPE